MKKYEVGLNYRYSEVTEENENKKNVNISEYGPDLLGASAIHLRHVDKEGKIIDFWFIWVGMFNEAIMKCVYKG